jgi:large subunit ribosomal protein L25
MAEKVELAIAPRNVLGKANKKLRKSGYIPANISGHNEPPQAVQVNSVEFERLRRARKATSIITLRLPDSSTETALIRHVQHGPSSGKVIHIDFSRVNLYERITARIPLRFVGEAAAVKLEGGVLLHLLDAVEVECMASDIVDTIEVDVSSMAHIDDMLHAHDIKLPANFTLTTDPEEAVAKVSATRASIEEAAPTTGTATPGATSSEA